MTEVVFALAKSFSCPWCFRAWPPYEEYAVCPCCREETVASKTVPNLGGDEEARKIALEFAFGWYLYDTDQL